MPQAMRTIVPFSVALLALLLAAGAAALVSTPAQAEKADRTKPMVVESDGKQSATVDLKSKTTVITGNVVIAQGTLLIKADRVEVREDVPGRYMANAKGNADKPATFRQKRDRVDEVVEAEAQRVEYDGANEKVRFIGDAKLRVVRPGVAPVVQPSITSGDGL